MSRGKSRSMSGSAVSSSLRKRPRNSSLVDRVDVREAGEVADDRGHRRAAPAARRQQRAHRRRAAHLDRHLARELEQVAVQQEEAGEAERVDHPQLLLEPGVRAAARAAVPARVALLEPRPAQLGELAERLLVLRARVAVAEVRSAGRRSGARRARAVSATASGCSGKRAAIASGEASTCEKLPRRSGSEASSVVWLRRATKASCSGAALARVRVDVAGGDASAPPGAPARSASARLRARSSRRNGRWSSTRRRSRPEGGEQRAQRRLVVDPVVGAAAQADEAGGVLGDRGERELRRHVDPPHAGADQRLVAALPSAALRDPRRLVDRPARVRVRPREQVAQVPPARARPRTSSVRWRPSSRSTSAPWIARSPSARGRLGELHRARDAVVVGERHRPVAELGRGGGQLVGQRGAVEEREGRVGVELDVHCEHMFA